MVCSRWRWLRAHPAGARYTSATTCEDEDGRAENCCAVSFLGAAGDGGSVSAQRRPARCPPGLALSKLLLTNQGLAGTLGFLERLRGIGRGGKGLFARFLADASGGDEVGMRQAARRPGAHITSGDDLPLSTADLLSHLTGARWRKLIGSGLRRRRGHRPRRAPQRAHRRGGREPSALKRIRVLHARLGRPGQADSSHCSVRT